MNVTYAWNILQQLRHLHDLKSEGWYRNLKKIYNNYIAYNFLSEFLIFMELIL